MRIRDLLTALTNRRKSNSRRRMVRPHELSEQLESRTLLTGNVLVSLSGAGAQFTGDAGNNEIEVVVDSGSIVVRGLNGTTINSGTAAFTLANASTTFPGNLTALLGDGNDIATIGPGITFTGNVALYGEGGSDTLRALTGTYQRSLTLAGGNGATSIVIDGATVGGSVAVRGLGSVVAGITGSTIHGRFDALTGFGNSADSIVIKGSTIDQTTMILTGRGDDNVVIQNSHLHGPLFMFTGADNDVVYIDSSSVGTPALIATQSGNDTLQVVNSSSFSRLLIFAGGGGKDSADIAGDTTSHRIIKASQNAKYFSSALVASRITDPTTGAIAAANALLTASVSGLTLSTSVATFSETAGTTASVLTATRTGPTTADAVVTLTSSNSSRVTVPATVTIPAGSTSATVNIAAIDNTLADGNAVVTITAAANGLTTATRTVTVTDNETATLTVTSNVATVAENSASGAVTFTVSRNSTDLTQPLTINVVSGTPGRLTVSATAVTIPANASLVTFTGSAVDNNLLDGNASVVVTTSATGFANGTATVTVTDNEAGTLAVTSNISTVAEGAAAGVLTFTVTRTSTDVSQPLIVSLTSALPARLTVPATVTIAANATTATFDGTPVNDDIVNGNVAVSVTASASDFANGTASVTVNDNDTDTGELTASPAASSIVENLAAGSFFYTVSRNTSDLTQALVVNLSSSNTGRLGVPATVTIPVGLSSVAFEVTPVNNTDADGNVDVVVTASATGLPNATFTLTVLDDEAAVAALKLTASLSVGSFAENSAAGASVLTVTRSSSDTTQPLIVALTYSETARLSGPATLTIPAGAVSATAPLSPIDNLTVDGDIQVDVTAAATGFVSGQQTLTITDNEVTTLTLTTAASSVSEASGTLVGTLSSSIVSSKDIVVSMFYPQSAVLTGPAVVTIPAGESSVVLTFTVVNGSVTSGSIVANISAVLPDLTGTSAAVTVNDADTMALTAVASASDSVQSNGTIITRQSTAQIAGVTTAGAVLTIDSNGDGVFDDGTATASGDGSYTVDVTLTNTATNHGENTFVVRAVSGANSADSSVKAHLAVGSVVHFTTNLGAWDVELLDAEAGLTVTNFLNYVTTGAFENMFVHRTNSGSAQFVQGGGFKVSDSQITPVDTNAPIQNQFNAANGNVAGTLAMALTAASIHSGTSGWFINTTDNSAGFDPGKYTVFGRVIGDGLTVVSQISNLTRNNLNDLYGSTALETVPLTSFNATNTPLTGQIATVANGAVLTGTGTLFTTELSVGQSVAINGRAYFVASIESNTSLTLKTTVPFTSSGGTVKKNVVPTDAEFVVFSDIGKILDTL